MVASKSGSLAYLGLDSSSSGRLQGDKAEHVARQEHAQAKEGYYLGTRSILITAIAGAAAMYMAQDVHARLKPSPTRTRTISPTWRPFLIAWAPARSEETRLTDAQAAQVRVRLGSAIGVSSSVPEFA